LDKLLIDLDKNKDIDYPTSRDQTTKTFSSSESSLDELIRSLTRNRKKDLISPRTRKNNKHKLATSASYLEKILNNDRRTDRDREFSYRPTLARSYLESFLDDDLYDYEGSRLLLDDDYENYLQFEGTGLKKAMRASRRLEGDLEELLYRLQRRY